MRFALALLLLALSGCAGVKPADTLSLREVSFSQLPGWPADDHAAALAALARSCPKMTAPAWQKICADLAAGPADARAFFETHFTPFEMSGQGGTEGLFTGYYEPTLRGSRTRHDAYAVPIYGRPNDLVTIDLGKFKPAWKGENIVGRVTAEKNVVPYYTRAEIGKGALKDGGEIVWVDSAVDAFFLHIQGSGRVVMEDGSVLRVGYAAQNGQPYLAVGKALVERGALTKDNVSMQTIRAWLAAHPAEAPQVMNLNASYIFFRPLDVGDADGPLGAQGVPLTPGRSLAVDRKKVSYGSPIWLDTSDPESGASLRRLMVAQDTGGAISGAVRGDFFWGAGDVAAHKAGLMKSPGRAWLLQPKSP